jgi:uncharacterized membrane protein YhfC
MEILVRLLNPLIMIALPLALAVFLVQRLGVPWRLFLIGASGFLASQILHIPFNAAILPPIFGIFRTGTGALVGTAALLGLSAAMFEECTRYLILRFWLKKERSWNQMIMYGLGHGGFEAMLVGVFALYAFFQAFALRGADLTALIPADQIQSVITNLIFYWDAPWHMVLLGALERGLAICLHLGLTALVWQAVVRGSLLWLGFAIFWHASANAIALIINQTWGSYLAEGFLALIAGISVYFIFALRNRGPEPIPIDFPEQPGAGLPSKVHETAEELSKRSLNDSRYMD